MSSKMTERENMMRTIFFQKPDYIPVHMVLGGAYYYWWYDMHGNLDDVFAVQERHPYLFKNLVRPKDTHAYIEEMRSKLPGLARKNCHYKDDFGCIWESSMDGITGTVTGHPLADLSNFASYQFPDPEVCMGIGPVNWKKERERIEAAKAAGSFVSAGLRHGHTYLQLTDLCGYENFTYYMMDEEPELEPLIKGVTDFNCAIIRKYLDMGVDMITIPEDLGMQQGPMITPENFRKYIMPSYQRMMDMVRKEGKILHMHSDGDIRSLVDDIIAGGCQVINLQDLVNGIDWIAEHFRGKTCVELDIDRQSVTYSGTPKDIGDLIREEVEKLSTPEGGLMMIYGTYPGIPLENVDALATALEKYTRINI